MGVLDAYTSPLKEGYAMSNDNAFKLIQRGAFEDQLIESFGGAMRGNRPSTGYTAQTDRMLYFSYDQHTSGSDGRGRHPTNTGARKDR